MYQGRHYPNWDGSAVWLGKPILDSKKDIRGIAVLHAATEGENDLSWHGLIKASVYAINPLSLRYPDNTNSGRGDYVIPEFASEMQQAQAVQHLLTNTNFDPELMVTFQESIENVCELLSVFPEESKNYWFAGFSVIGLYKEGESGEECWNRMYEDNGVLEFLMDTISQGELQEGMLSYMTDEGIELPEMSDRYTPKMKQELVKQINALQHRWGEAMVRAMNERCESGLIHRCRKGDEVRLKRRGKFTPQELFLPRVDEWLNPLTATGLTVNKQSAENYRRLVETFKGDGYSIEPSVNEYGDIVLQWRVGPSKVGEAILAGDGGMHLDLDYLDTAVPKTRPPKFIEVKAHIDFNEDTLSKFIETGKLPNNE